jgi:hypothetical protein
VQRRDSSAHQRHAPRGTPVACLNSNGGSQMLMFKRSQIYVGLGLAAVVELIIRVVAH